MQVSKSNRSMLGGLLGSRKESMRQEELHGGPAPCLSPTSPPALSPEMGLLYSFSHANIFLSTYYVPSTMLDAENGAADKTMRSLYSCIVYSQVGETGTSRITQ